MQYVTDSLLGHIADAKKRGERSLITTLTKKSSEELAEYLAENGLKVKYLHSEVETIDRLDILRDLRLGKIEVIVGVNLLREGLDLPEVSFIGILDAEKIGFLRSTRSLLQIIGRASRNVNGHVVMYSTKKKLSSAMTEAIEETNRRRTIQTTYNEQHHIIPTTIISSIKDLGMKGKKKFSEDTRNETGDRDTLLKRLELEMDVAAANLEFEKAADLRDRIMELMTEKGK
jgi:excinuclease ABC subunit B